MATLIPALGSCVKRMTPGERRLAERLEQKLEDDYLCWYDVPIGPASAHPDFVVLHPRRGLIILEVKDWRLDTVISADRLEITISTATGQKKTGNPLEQARQYAFAVANLLQRDDLLRFSSGAHTGKLIFPWAYGAVLSNITRKQFEQSGLAEVMAPNHVICSDEMTEAEGAERFQKRLWDMFTVSFKAELTPPQTDRVRWHMFPEIRIQQGELFKEEQDIMRVMDLKQEHLARSLGEGHRVIHGVAGSGKTLILGYRAQQLAQVCVKPILVLCYNKSLAKRLACNVQGKGAKSKIEVRPFHQWCRSQLVAAKVALPPDNKDPSLWSSQLVDTLVRAVDRGVVPRAQYDAVLIDEAHDFEPEWLKLAVQMVDPRTNSLLVLYDDAQSIYSDHKKRRVSFKTVGILASGRTTILRVNYRNTQEILDLASATAAGLLIARDSDDDGAPVISPVGGGRSGPAPVILKLQSIQDEMAAVIAQLKAAHQTGTPWREMAVIYRQNWAVGSKILSAVEKAGIPVIDHRNATFAETEDAVKFLTMHSCKGLEFRFVVIPGTRLLAKDGEEGELDARLLYVAMTRATQQLVVFQ
jgi:hypothetical protein